MSHLVKVEKLKAAFDRGEVVEAEFRDCEYMRIRLSHTVLFWHHNNTTLDHNINRQFRIVRKAHECDGCGEDFEKPCACENCTRTTELTPAGIVRKALPFAEVCHCGELMKDHDGYRGCTTPREMEDDECDLCGTSTPCDCEQYTERGDHEPYLKREEGE